MVEAESRISALTKARIPLKNHEFIAQFTAAVGIGGCCVVAGPDKCRVVATRLRGGPDLHIYYGYTTGFTSEEEVLRCAGGGVERGLSTSRKQTWFVKHPTNRVRY